MTNSILGGWDDARFVLISSQMASWYIMISTDNPIMRDATPIQIVVCLWWHCSGHQEKERPRSSGFNLPARCIAQWRRDWHSFMLKISRDHPGPLARCGKHRTPKKENRITCRKVTSTFLRLYIIDNIYLKKKHIWRFHEFWIILACPLNRPF